MHLDAISRHLRFARDNIASIVKLLCRNMLLKYSLFKRQVATIYKQRKNVKENIREHRRNCKRMITLNVAN
eukprot:6043468-Pleurochrysis_carterae.AAC.1